MNYRDSIFVCMKIMECFFFFNWYLVFPPKTSLPPTGRDNFPEVKHISVSLADSVAIQVLVNKLKTTTIKDYSGETSTPLGDFEYDLTK